MTRTFPATMLALAALLSPQIAAAVTFKATVTQDMPDLAPGDGYCSIFPVSGMPEFTICSLRAAIMEGNATPLDQSVTVQLKPGATYVLNTPEPNPQGAKAGDLDITRPMTVGIPADSTWRAKVDGNQISRVFDLHESATNTVLYGLEITGGHEEEHSESEGVAIRSAATNAGFNFLDVHTNTSSEEGIACAVYGSVTLVDSRVHHNGTEHSSVRGVCNWYGTVVIERSTIDNNSMDGINIWFGSLFLINSTVTGSGATGLWLRNVHATIANSTIFSNDTFDLHLWASEDNFHLNMIGSIIGNDDAEQTCNFYTSGQGKVSMDASWNIYSDATCALDESDTTSPASGAILLSELSDWGGPTPTMLPLPGSDAIDRAPAVFCGESSVDQRGLPRPVASVEGGPPLCDIGAVELTTMPDEDLPPNGIFVNGFEDI